MAKELCIEKKGEIWGGVALGREAIFLLIEKVLKRVDFGSGKRGKMEKGPMRHGRRKNGKDQEKA